MFVIFFHIILSLCEISWFWLGKQINFGKLVTKSWSSGVVVEADRDESFSNEIKQKLLYCTLKNFISLASNLSF